MDSNYPTQLKRFALQHLKNYLDPVSLHNLIEEAQKLGRELQKEKWKFVISREDPITFKTKDSNLQIDITCKIEGSGDEIKEYNVELQVRSLEEGNGEPIIKFHIDKKVPSTQEPWHHLHIGENDEPRFPFPPMDVILLSEFILINYFPEDSENLRKDGGWKDLVLYSQNIFQRQYFSVCQNCIENNSNSTLMEHLLNHP